MDSFLNINARLLSFSEPSLLVKDQIRSLRLDIASLNSHFIFAVCQGKKIYSVPSGGEVIPPKQHKKIELLKIESSEIGYIKCSHILLQRGIKMGEREGEITTV